MSRTCPRCRAEAADAAAFCPSCGAPLGVPPTPPGEVPAPPPVSPPRVDPSPDRGVFKRVSLLVMILLSLVTLGIYPGVWLYLRREAFNRLSAAARLEDFLVYGVLGANILSVAVSVADAASSYGSTSFLASLVSLASFVLTVLAAFRIRTQLRDYARRKDPSGLAADQVARSPLWTFLFSFLYIQHHLNRLLDAGLLETPRN